MIEKIITGTNITKDTSRLLERLDFSIGMNRFSKDDIDQRQSYRLFNSLNKRIVLEDVDDFYRLFKENLKALGSSEKEVAFYFSDNDNLIGSKATNPKIYRIRSNQVEEQLTHEKITRNDLYIQEEMHDASVVIFFVWEISSIGIDLEASYRDMMMVSAYLGHQISLLGQQKGLVSTVFAGITANEFRGLLVESDDKLPIFAIALE